jgi:hypothetical protein
VLGALLRRCEELKIELRTDRRVTQILLPAEAAPGPVSPVPEGEDGPTYGSSKLEGRSSNQIRISNFELPSNFEFRASSFAIPEPPFAIHHTHGTLLAARIIVSAGGRSLPRSGSDGSGWELVQKLGHTVTPTFAALVPLVLAPEMFHAELSGIAQDVELSTFVNGKRIDQRTGSLLWTHFGISGPVVMDASRHWTSANEAGAEPRMICSVLPGEDFTSVEQWLIQAAAQRPRGTVVGQLAQRLPERVAACLLRHVGIDPSLPIGQLPRDARRAVVHALTALPLPVTQHRGWNYAEVTAGGVPLSEIDPRTMQSRKIPGLYLAGEILDCDGRIGGFNFQWAWSTAYLAGNAAAKTS